MHPVDIPFHRRRHPAFAFALFRDDGFGFQTKVLRWTERRKDLGFALVPGEVAAVTFEDGKEELSGNVAGPFLVAGSKGFAHAARAEQVDKYAGAGFLARARGVDSKEIVQTKVSSSVRARRTRRAQSWSSVVAADWRREAAQAGRGPNFSVSWQERTI